ncbi:ABC-2 family transporter protein [Planctomycetota bacterium]|nr:ABC-2 family transporter protein [Planctomycetota bacterium]
MSPRLFWEVLLTEARRGMSYRADFWITLAGGLVSGLVIPYFLWSAVFAETGAEEIGGYTFRSMIVYYVLVVLIAKVVRGVEGFSAGAISQEIYDGSLNRYLVYPTSYLPFKYAQHLGGTLPAVLQLLVLGGVCAFAIGLPIGALELALTLASLMAAHLLWFLLVYPLHAVAFWADNVWSLVVLLRFGSALFGGAMIPLALFPGPVQDALRWTPFPHLFYGPVNTLLGKTSPQECVIGIAVVLAWCAVTLVLGSMVWRRGLRSYSGVGI